jgi:hypothetical protein
LVEDSHGEGGEDSEEDVVEGEGPGFEDDLTGEGVLEGELRWLEMRMEGRREGMTYPELGHE